MLGIHFRKQKLLPPALKQIYLNKFAKTGSVKERLINTDGNVVEIFRPGLETRLYSIGVSSITKTIRKNTAKNPIIDRIEIQGRISERKYEFVNDETSNTKAKEDAFAFLRKGIGARRAGYATTI